MFTGIVEQIGVIKRLSLKKDVYRLEVLPRHQLGSLKEGDSLSISGVCLTLVGIKRKLWSFDIMKETYEGTSFSHLRYNDIVNIERALEWKSLLNGHFVLGHVDSVQKIKSIRKENPSYIDVSIFVEDKMYVVRKGSIAIDGISLTVAEVYKDRIRVYVIPYTLENTNLKYKKAGAWVNIEFDILGKYIHNRVVCQNDKDASFTEEFLKNKGMI